MADPVGGGATALCSAARCSSAYKLNSRLVGSRGRSAERSERFSIRSRGESTDVAPIPHFSGRRAADVSIVAREKETERALRRVANSEKSSEEGDGRRRGIPVSLPFTISDHRRATMSFRELAVQRPSHVARDYGRY